WNMIVSDGALVNFYGYKSVATIQTYGTARELFNSQGYGHLIAVIDNNVYTIAPDYTKVLVGSIDTFDGPVFIAENQELFNPNTTPPQTTGGSQIAIVDGLN